MIHILHLKNTPIFKQLQLEEALLRSDTRNFCIINEGSPPAIVMGISGKPHKLVALEQLSQTSIPLIKRFSGGGTVVVNEDTLFVSFLFQSDFHDFVPYPEPIMQWTEKLYQNALAIPDFHLRENDYVIGEKKCGGNAQYLRKSRWLHHTTFLWDYKKEQMDLLLHPEKTPKYRMQRSHDAFLTRLREYLPSKQHFITKIKDAIGGKEIAINDLIPILDRPHRKSTASLPLTS